MPAIVNAQSGSARRSDSWEWSIAGMYQESKYIGSEDASYLDVDSAIGFGINFAYHLSSKLSVGGDFEFLSPDYKAVLVDENGIADDVVVKHEMSQFNGRFKGTFNFIDAPFTPYVEVGLGWSYFDSNVSDGPPLVGCWWHPIWGYICDGYFRTYNDTLFSYGAGAGLRYELRNGSFLKLSYNVWELDGLGKAADSSIPATKLELGWLF